MQPKVKLYVTGSQITSSTHLELDVFPDTSSGWSVSWKRHWEEKKRTAFKLALLGLTANPDKYSKERPLINPTPSLEHQYAQNSSWPSLLTPSRQLEATAGLLKGLTPAPATMILSFWPTLSFTSTTDWKAPTWPSCSPSHSHSGNSAFPHHLRTRAHQLCSHSLGLLS